MRTTEPALSADPILIILHQETSTPGRVGQKLVQRGYQLDIRRPRFGDPLPQTMAQHTGAIIFGGPMSAYDQEPFLDVERDWIGVALQEEAPFLGLCLGAQLLAQHCGAEVAPNRDGIVEVGYYPIAPTPEGEALIHWPDMVYQWHQDGFELPRGATRLVAGTGAFPEQAFQIGKAAFALQFHPELTTAMTYRWTVLGAERMLAPGAQPRKAHLQGRLLYEPAVDAWLDAFLDHWLALRTGQAVSAPSSPIGAQSGHKKTAAQTLLPEHVAAE